MSIKSYRDLNDLQFDALKEIGNIGSGNAASSLSQLLERPVKISVPTVRILDYTTVVDHLGGAEKMMTGILLTLAGDVSGMMMFLLHQEFVQLILTALTGKDADLQKDWQQIDHSVVQEVGNIMAGSYVNAIASLTGLTIGLTSPEVCMDMVGSIFSTPAIYFADISDQIICIEDQFAHTAQTVSSHIFLIPEVCSLQRIMDCLGL